MFLFVLDRVYISVEGVFVFYGALLTEIEVQRSLFLFQEVAICCIQNAGGALRAILKLNHPDK